MFADVFCFRMARMGQIACLIPKSDHEMSTSTWGGTPPWRRPGLLCFTEVGSVMKSTQRGLQITLGFFEAGLWTTISICLQKALLNIVGLVAGPWSKWNSGLKRICCKPAGWDSHHPRQDVEIPSANLRTPYMYDAAQERWARELNVWQKEWKEISTKRSCRQNN